MKAAAFDYRAPESLDEALALRAEHGHDGVVLAGGQSLVPLLNLRMALPAVVVDLGRVPGLAGIRELDGGVAVGAMTRMRDAERSALLAERYPLVGAALAHVGYPAIRNRGTVGGSIAHGDPAAELPAVALALDAELVVRSAARGTRTIPASEFFLGTFTTALEPDELLVEVRLPAPRTGARSGFDEVARRHGDFALAGAAAVVALDAAGTVVDARVAVLGVHGSAVRLPELEQALVGALPREDRFRDAAESAVAQLEPNSDVHASAGYRRRVAAVTARRALLAATVGEGGGR